MRGEREERERERERREKEREREREIKKENKESETRGVHHGVFRVLIWFWTSHHRHGKIQQVE